MSAGQDHDRGASPEPITPKTLYKLLDGEPKRVDVEQQAAPVVERQSVDFADHAVHALTSSDRVLIRFVISCATLSSVPSGMGVSPTIQRRTVRSLTSRPAARSRWKRGP
jgi:hypothetical protein